MEKNLKIILFVLLFLVINPFQVIAAENDGQTTPILEDKQTKVSEYLYIIEDKNKEWTIEDVLNYPVTKQFERNQKRIPNFGYTNSAYWAHFKIKNETKLTEQLLEISYPPLNEIDIYIFDESMDLVDELNFGAKYPFYDRDIIHPYYNYIFNIETDETLNFYIRFETEGSMQMPISVWDQAGFIKERQDDYMLLGIFYGITGVMALYNLFLFFALRHKSYLYYVAVIIATSLISLSLNGIAYQYFWPELPWWNMRSIVFFMSIGAVFSLLFANSFLSLKKFLPKTKRILNILIVVNLFIAILVFFSYKIALNLMILGYGSMIILILVSAFLSLKKGVRQARFFIIAWCVFLFGVLISLLADSAIVPLTGFTRNIWQVSAALEVVLLSFALADRINILRNEKDIAVQQSQKSQQLALDNLKRSDKLKNEFLAITSHELRTPLNGIIGIAETLREGVAGTINEKVQSHLTMIVISGKRLSNLINDILDYSSLKNNQLTVNLVPVHLYELTNVVLTICRPLVKDTSIKLKNKIEPSTPVVLADENRLQQILYNLIGNAIKYTEKGEVVISAERENGYLTVSVADTGKGIRQEKLPSIFDHFYQVIPGSEREIGGSGIGLSITKQLVELHEGEVHVESEVGTGSIFSFTLQIVENENQREEAAATIVPFMKEIEKTELITTASESHYKETAKVLIADDEAVNLQVLTNQLSLEGYEVITAKNGEEVLTIVEEEPVDLLILDIMMPKMSGYEVCQQLRKKYSLMDLPILMLTAKNQIQDRVTSFEIGANDYLAKPCDKQELLSRVKTLIQLRRLNQELVTMNYLLENKVKERTQALKYANKDLERANNDLIALAESRNVLLANIGHELGTPVTLIHGYVQAVQEGLIQMDEPSYLEMVSSKVKLLDRLISDLSDLAILGSGQSSLNIREMDVAEWLNHIYKWSEIDIKQADRQVSLPSSNNLNSLKNYTCFIDIERLDQVLSNLIWNAYNYTLPETGKITISHHIDIVNDEIVIEVKDNGEGISEEKVLFIFERFYKATVSKEGGTGLGLAIVKEIIQSHQGRIWVESIRHVGSTFYIALPIKR